MDGITTEVIDKLFLELSQITSAHTAMELRLMRALRELVKCKDLKESIDMAGDVERQATNEGQASRVVVRD